MSKPRFTPEQQRERKIKAWQEAKTLRSQAQQIAKLVFGDDLDRKFPKIANAVTEEIRLLSARIERYEREIDELEVQITAKGGSHDER